MSRVGDQHNEKRKAMKSYKLPATLLFLALLALPVGSALESQVEEAVPAQPASGQAMQPARPATRAIPAVPMRVLQPAPATAASVPKAIATLEPGAAAPDFVSKDLSGKEVKLSSFRDKVVVLDFWAPWCGPCRASLPHTQEVAKRSKEQGVVVLASCTSDTRASFEEFVKANQEKYPDVLFTCDPNERGSASYADRASLKLYGVRGIPTQFVIGRDGKIAAAIVGYSQGDERLDEALSKLGIKGEA